MESNIYFWKGSCVNLSTNTDKFYHLVCKENLEGKFESYAVYGKTGLPGFVKPYRFDNFTHLKRFVNSKVNKGYSVDFSFMYSVNSTETINARLEEHFSPHLNKLREYVVNAQDDWLRQVLMGRTPSEFDIAPDFDRSTTDKVTPPEATYGHIWGAWS